jgi:hypothetical protein
MRQSNRLLICVFVAFFSAGCASIFSGGSCPVSPGTNYSAPIASSGQTSESAPSLQVSEPSYDFGEVEESTVLSHAFRIKNSGTEVLEIKNVLPG